MASNIEITAQLNNMLQEQNQLYLQQAKILRGQLAVMQQMAEVFSTYDPCANIDCFQDLNSQTAMLDQQLQNLAKSSQSTQSDLNNLNATGEETKNIFDKMSEGADSFAQKLLKVSPAALALDGAVRGFQFSLNLLKGAGNILGSIIEGIWGVAKALLAMPFDMWNALFAKAGQPVDTALAEKLEEIRRQFGDLKTGSALAVRDIARSLKGTLEGTGLSANRVFGNMVERLEAARKVAGSLGPMFNQLSDSIVQNSQAIMQFQKGMGTTEEGMKAFGRMSIVTGRNIGDLQREAVQYASALGKAFNINTREITQDLNDMVGDMKHFGGQSMKALNETAVYARRLGIEVKNLTGLMDAFDNFDNAADATARLNQQFGIQIDTMEIMKADNPAERAEQLRKAFEASGRSIETLDRRSKSYLASQIGLSEADAELLFAEKNRGMTLDQIKRKSEEAEKKQISQREALERITSSIDRVIKAGRTLTGIFKSFFDGFMAGFERSADVRRFFRELRSILQGAFQAGYSLGRVFVDIFPAIKNVMGALLRMFEPQRFRRMFRDVVDAFKQFFRTVETDPEAGLRTLFERLQEAFFNWFDADNGRGSSLLESFKRFFRLVLTTIATAIRMSIPAIMGFLTDGIKAITDFIRGGGVGNSIDSALLDADSVGGQVAGFLRAIGQAFADAWPALWDAIKDLFSTIWTKLQEWYSNPENADMVKKGLLIFFGILFGPAIILSLSGLIAGVLGRALLAGASAVFKGGGTGGAGGVFKNVRDAITNSISSSTNAEKKGPEPSGVKKALDAGQEILGTIKDIQKNGGITGGDISTAAKFSLFVVAGVGPIILAIAGLAAIIEQGGISITSILAASAAMLAAALVVSALSGVGENIKKNGRNVPSTITMLNFIGFVTMFAVSGMVAVGLMVAAVTLLGFTAMIKATVVLGAIAVLFGGLTILAKAVQEFGKGVKNYQALITGTLAIGAFSIAFSAIAGAMVRLFDMITTGISAERIKAAGAVMLAISGIMLMMIPLGIAAMAVGAVLAIPGVGAALGVAALAGIAALGGFALAVVEVGGDIIREASNINLTEGMKEKVQVLIDIMKGLTDFTKAISAIVVSLTISSLGDTRKFRRLFRQVSDFIGDIKQTSIDFIREVKEIADTLGNETELKKLTAVTDVIVSLAEFMKSIADVVKMSGEGGWYESTDYAMERFNTQFDNIIMTIKGQEGNATLPGIGSLVSSLLNDVNIPGTPEQITAEAKAVGDVLSSLGNFIKNIADIGRGIIGSRDAERLIPAMADFLTDMLDAVFKEENRETLFGIIGSIVEAFTGNTANLSETQVKGMSALAELIGPMLEAIASIFQVLENFAPTFRNTDGSTMDASAFDRLVGLFIGNETQPGFLSLIANFVPYMVQQINNLFTGRTAINVNTLKTRTTAVKGVVEVIGSLSQTLMDSFSALKNSLPSSASGSYNIQQGLNNLAQMFGIATIRREGEPSFISAGEANIFSIMREIIRKFSEGGTNGLGTLIDDFNNSKTRMTKLASLGTAMKTFADIAGTVETVRGAFTKTAATGTSAAVMIDDDDIKAMFEPVESILTKFNDAAFVGSIESFDTNKLNPRKMGRISAFASSFGNFAQNISDGLEDIDAEFAGRAVEIVGQFGEVVNALNTIAPINYVATLDRVAGALGLHSENYTITNRNFNIVLNLDVKMQVDHVEEILFTRAETAAVTTGRPLRATAFRAANRTGGFGNVENIE